ncbi:MAG: hypothetical protein JWQ11_1666, partial [Rhizobacter sp.]|nr:hypothetical protein [Rhizobacter sp.]
MNTVSSAGRAAPTHTPAARK